LVDKVITLAHGDGGAVTRSLLKSVFLKHFANEHLEMLYDSAVLDLNGVKLAVTTDSFVVSPIFFPGGDIGKLAVCGTVNDLAVSGAVPLYISDSFLIEEGFAISSLERIVRSMSEAARDAGVAIVTGDTKVVERGHIDNVFINTTGIGLIDKDLELGYHRVNAGDKVIVNGPVGNHGLTIMMLRQKISIAQSLKSDCASLVDIIQQAIHKVSGIKLMRDLTRGGLATALKEIALDAQVDIWLVEDQIPVDDTVRAGCDMLGLDPLYLANEGKFAMIVSESDAEKALDVMKHHPLGKGAKIVGEVREGKGDLLLRTALGGTRRLDLLAGQVLPRIC